jgi:hypothetical protein
MDIITPTKARRLISDCLKEIGNEESESVVVDGEPVMVTKSMALARMLWKMALGGMIEYRDDKGQACSMFCKPDRQTARLIFEYTEGKPPATVPGGGKNAKQGEFDTQTKTRLANILGKG